MKDGSDRASCHKQAVLSTTQLGIGLSLALGIAAGLSANNAQALPPNACTYTNSATGGSNTYCGPCSNDTAGVTTSATYVAACASGTAPAPKKKTPKQQPKAPPTDEGGAK